MPYVMSDPYAEKFPVETRSKGDAVTTLCVRVRAVESILS